VSSLPIHAVFSEALDVLDASGLGYAVMGGFAVRALGLPRPTYDGDLLVDADENATLELIRRFDVAGFRIPDEFSKGYRDELKGMQKIEVHKFEERHDWRIDIFFPSTPLLMSAYGRRRPLRFMSRECSVLTVEDLLLLKLLAGRTKDKLDVEELLKLHAAPDVGYLREWAARLNLAPELERALADSGR
jgi:hypothetical protein